MRVSEYKGYRLSSAMSAYNFYKRSTGHSLQGDITKITAANPVLNKLSKLGESDDANLTEKEIKLLEEIDFFGIISEMYCAFRKAGDPSVRNMSTEELLDHDEIGIEDQEELAVAVTKILGGSESSKK